MTPLARNLRLFLALLLVAAGPPLAVAADAADFEGELVGAAMERFCSEGRQHHCDEVKAFAAGQLPAFPPGRHVFVGRVFVDPGRKEGGGYLALFVEERGGAIRIAAERLRPDNKEERAAIEAFISNEGGARRASRLRSFLDGSWNQVELQAVRKSARSLVVEGARGASAVYRAQGGRLLSLQLARRPKGSYSSLPMLTLMSFPSAQTVSTGAQQRK